MAEDDSGEIAPINSRTLSGTSVGSDELASLTSPLLGSRQFTLPEELSIINLERFFRVCADTLAKQHDHPSRAATVAFDAPRRARTLDFEPASPVENRTVAPPARQDVFPTRPTKLDLDALDFDRSEEWAAKPEEWSAVLDSVEDVWRYYFPDCDHRAGVGATSHGHQCHPFSNKSARMQAQRDLLLARLCIEHGSSNIQDATSFLPWLSTIGYKLEQIHTFSPAFAETLKPRKRSRKTPCGDNLLTCALRYFYEGSFHYLARHSEICISWMLEFCYMRGALPRPQNDDDQVLDTNFRHLVHALWCLNIIQTPRYQLTFTYSWNQVEQRLPVMGPYLLGLRPRVAVEKSFEDIERRLQEEQPKLPLATGENVRCMDLNIQALRNIGGLKIVWTTCDRDHLFLDQESGVLRLSWFNRVLVPEFYQYMPMLGRNDVNRTWEMLLSHRKQQYDFTDLDKVAIAPELYGFNKLCRKNRVLRWQQQQSGSLRHDPRRTADIYEKYGSLPNLPRSVPYSYFGRYEQRVRTLRHYMDNRRPTGFKNMWHDRRDTLAYYGFWAVIIFGGISILIALLSLTVGILQAYASFKAIPPS